MYRYSANSEITYTPEDLVLYRESPFASWMERLTLENPEHGIAPDETSKAQQRAQTRRHAYQWCEQVRSERLGWQDFVSGVSTQVASESGNEVGPAAFPAGTHSGNGPCNQSSSHLDSELSARGNDVVRISKYAAEPERRAATLTAMRRGAEYIAHAQLAVGPLSCSIELLIRSEGISELGGYLYLPLCTRKAASITDGGNAIPNLCFAADLLESLQGTLPPQLLLMNAREGITCLPTQDHIHRFRDLKYAFMQAQLSFRKHRMPDPAESAHYGRWSSCAHSVLQQRASNREDTHAPGSNKTLAFSTAPVAYRGLADAMQLALATSKSKTENNDSHQNRMARRRGNAA